MTGFLDQMNNEQERKTDHLKCSLLGHAHYKNNKLC